MSKIILSHRLQAIANMVTPGKRLVDVGCDHGYLPIVLVEKEICPEALCCDVNRGPLASAEKHIRQHPMCAGKIHTMCSDGLMELDVKAGESLVIAGMGGNLTIRILKGRPDVRKAFHELILQPQSEISLVRKFLEEEYYEIVREEMVREDGKYYPMMKAIPRAGISSDRRNREDRKASSCERNGDGDKISDFGRNEDGCEVFACGSNGEGGRSASGDMTPWELEYGPLLLQDRHPVLREFLQNQKVVKTDIFTKLRSNISAGDRIHSRIKEVEYELFLIEKALEYYEKSL